jgi:hypothetical protein
MPAVRCLDMAGRLMIWLLPVFLVALTLVAMGLQRRATKLYGDVCCLPGRHNHSLSPYLATQRGHH